MNKVTICSDHDLSSEGWKRENKKYKKKCSKIAKYIRKKSLTSQKSQKNTKILFLKFHEKNIKVNDFLLNFTKKDHAD